MMNKTFMLAATIIFLAAAGNCSRAQFPPFYCGTGNTYTAISGSPGPSGDDVTITASLPFTFTYLGTGYTQVSICTNGWVGMGATSSSTYDNDLCTTDPGDLKKLCPFWDDLNTEEGGDIQYATLGITPNRIFVVQWTNVGYYDPNGNVTFQVRLYESSNLIEFIYGTAVPNAGASGSVGLNDNVGGSGHVVSVTPGATCGTTTTSNSACNNDVPYISPNLGPGVKYSFGNPLGIINNNGYPKVYKLYDNYPNPFNPSTTIKFDIPKPMDLKLSVYNSVGQLIAVLARGHYEAGSYSIQWDGKDYSSGLYLYKLESDNFTDVKKMLLVK